MKESELIFDTFNLLLEDYRYLQNHIRIRMESISPLMICLYIKPACSLRYFCTNRIQYFYFHLFALGESDSLNN